MQATLLEVPRKRSMAFNPKEFKIMALRECPMPEEMQVIDTPFRAADYFRQHVMQHPYFNPDTECFVVMLLNTRSRIKGHHLVSMGSLDTVLVHPREVFRAACIGSAAALILAHNHPSGEHTPSEADIRVTRDLRRAGEMMKISILDHVIIGNPNVGQPGFSSLKELGYFY